MLVIFALMFNLRKLRSIKRMLLALMEFHGMMLSLRTLGNGFGELLGMVFLISISTWIWNYSSTSGILSDIFSLDWLNGLFLVKGALWLFILFLNVWKHWWSQFFCGVILLSGFLHLIIWNFMLRKTAFSQVVGWNRNDVYLFIFELTFLFNATNFSSSKRFIMDNCVHAAKSWILGSFLWSWLIIIYFLPLKRLTFKEVLLLEISRSWLPFLSCRL